jgi:menaquinone-dependent protoporphyrinogen IX oxidase/nitroimidazol reductase NimA-like FMN-containing flavoprotein (pyridoxamine 5'-phosphate oxidase superfamily)
MQKTLVLFESRYGSTEEAAKILALILGPAKTCPVDKFRDRYIGFDLFVIGTPLYSGEIDPKISQFVQKNISWLKDKNTALFCLCLDPHEGEAALEKLRKLLGIKVIGWKAFGGMADLEKLEGEDGQTLKAYYEKTGLPLESVDLVLKEDIVEFALEIKRARDRLGKSMPSEKLKPYVEDFLKKHNTCTLSTAFKDRVRATPIEYSYHDGKLYMLSEGGEKFANILLNSRVSLAVYDDYQGMDKLAGMQITGRASLVSSRDQEHEEILRLEGQSLERITALPFALNMIRIEMERVEFLNADFKKMGQDVRQILFF